MKTVMNSLMGLACVAMMSSPVWAGGDADAGKAKSQACASCHGADGNSPSPQFPNLAGQQRSYLLHALKAYKSGDRKNPLMAGMVAALTEEDMENLAAYFSAQSGLRDTASD
ncbi:MAG TPA: cytochrome c [Gammaproteobacteria bacterium]|nr:cytochrome c [Gammaproteobacteria bacterium]